MTDNEKPIKLPDPRDILDFLDANPNVTREQFVEEMSVESVNSLHAFLLSHKDRLYDHANKLSGLGWAIDSPDQAVTDILTHMRDREIMELGVAYRNIYDNHRNGVDRVKAIRQWNKDTLLLSTLNIDAAVKSAYGKKGRASKSLREQIKQKKAMGLPLTDDEKRATKSRVGSAAKSILKGAAVGVGALGVAALAKSKSGRAIMAVVGGAAALTKGASSFFSRSSRSSESLSSFDGSDSSSSRSRGSSSSSSDSAYQTQSLSLLKEISEGIKSLVAGEEEDKKEDKKTGKGGGLMKVGKSLMGGMSNMSVMLPLLGIGAIGLLGVLLAKKIKEVIDEVWAKMKEYWEQFKVWLKEAWAKTEQALVDLADTAKRIFKFLDPFGASEVEKDTQRRKENQEIYQIRKEKATKTLEEKGFGEIKSEEDFKKYAAEQQRLKEENAWNPASSTDLEPNLDQNMEHTVIEQRMADWRGKQVVADQAKELFPIPQGPITKEQYEAAKKRKNEAKDFDPNKPGLSQQLQGIINNYEQSDEYNIQQYENTKQIIQKLKEPGGGWNADRHAPLQQRLEDLEAKLPSTYDTTGSKNVEAITIPIIGDATTLPDYRVDPSITIPEVQQRTPRTKQIPGVPNTTQPEPYVRPYPIPPMEVKPTPWFDAMPPTYEGGYKFTENAFVPEKKIESVSIENKTISAFDKLWDAAETQGPPKQQVKPNIINAPQTTVNNVMQKISSPASPINNEQSLHSAMGFV